jgi:CRP/FNR family transcriptional regulator, cyclic AMP receptor protein
MTRDLPALVPGLTRLNRVSLFTGLPDLEVSALERQLPVIRWIYGQPPPADVARPGYLYLVRDGRLALLDTTRSGHPIMLALIEEGAVYSALGDGRPPRVDALCDAAISPLSERLLERLIDRYPRVGVNLAAALSDRMSMLRDIAVVLGEVRIEDRLRARLAQIATRLGRVTPEGVRIPLELTHAQWALLVGASRESVTIAFGRLRAQGAVHVEGRTVTLSWEGLGDPEGAAQDAPPAPEAAQAVAP